MIKKKLIYRILDKFENTLSSKQENHLKNVCSTNLQKQKIARVTENILKESKQLELPPVTDIDGQWQLMQVSIRLKQNNVKSKKSFSERLFGNISNPTPAKRLVYAFSLVIIIIPTSHLHTPRVIPSAST